jgi:hypothetical protein
VRKPQGKRPLGRHRQRWEDYIKMDLRRIGRVNMDWIHLAQDREQWRALVKIVMNLRVLQNISNFLNSSANCGFSRRTKLHVVT